MKEYFEDKRITGAINVACKYDDGTVRYWTTQKEHVVKRIIAIVARYDELGYKLTLRQLHYQMVSHDPAYVNHDTAYKKLGRILDDCRYSGLIDWDAIEDRGRTPYIPYSVDSPEEALNDAKDYYRRNRQQDQQEVVELWTEKDALSGILKRSTEKYHIQLCVNKGYTSSSAIYGAYRRVIDYVNTGRKVTILYFGDHDPSGLDMVRDIEDRLYFFMRKGRFGISNPEDFLEIRAIGLTMAQVKKYKLPPNPTKLTDTRSNGYILEHGTTCWEVDALDPRVLTALVEDQIEGVIDMELYEKIRQDENTERAKMRKLIDEAIKRIPKIKLTDDDVEKYNRDVD